MLASLVLNYPCQFDGLLWSYTCYVWLWIMVFFYLLEPYSLKWPKLGMRNGLTWSGYFFCVIFKFLVTQCGELHHFIIQREDLKNRLGCFGSYYLDYGFLESMFSWVINILFSGSELIRCIQQFLNSIQLGYPFEY